MHFDSISAFDSWQPYTPVKNSVYGTCRLLVHVAEGPLDGRQPGGDELYRFFRTNVDWPSLLRPGQTFSVQARL